MQKIFIINKKKAFTCVFLATVICILYFLFLYRFPLKLPDRVLKMHLLSNAPIGSTVQEVRTFIESSSYTIANPSFLTLEVHFPYDVKYKNDLPENIKALRVNLGNYQSIPFMANVTTFWFFNNNDQLIDIRFWRTYDGL